MKDEASGKALDLTRAYHQRSKHLPHRHAASLGYLDWDTQPDPFRRFDGARTFSLELDPPGPEPRYEPAFVAGNVDPRPVDAAAVARLFQDALSLSAWKAIPGTRWALRVNPSSGNLHPTEGYLVGPAFTGHLSDLPAVYHYAPHDHALELRAELSDRAWRRISGQLPEGGMLVGLTSIYWREAWKYGERAFRYCHHDVGHAIACISIAAAGLGWDARLLEAVPDDDLGRLLGVDSQSGVEAEHPDCLIAVFPHSGAMRDGFDREFRLDDELMSELAEVTWTGEPNTLSTGHQDWPVIDDVAAATTRHAGPPDRFWSSHFRPAGGIVPGDSLLSFRELIHQRRSAVALDGRTGITRKAFYQILSKTMPGADLIPFATLPWPPSVDLLLFVHRVEDLPGGLYVLVRDPRQNALLRGSLDSRFSWTRAEGCPDALEFFCLEEGDARRVARRTSCNQDIAADGAFAVALLARYRQPLEDFGSWFYRRLFWETGAIGQVLYLEAEATGIRGTGIGCFFDDLTHRVFGIEGDDFQVLYHFTMGGPVEDRRLETHPPYAHLGRRGGSRGS
jgi:SagB-type dehydrogenase family enzyme